jgi:hypothetical protein
MKEAMDISLSTFGLIHFNSRTIDFLFTPPEAASGIKNEQTIE